MITERRFPGLYETGKSIPDERNAYFIARTALYEDLRDESADSMAIPIAISVVADAYRDVDMDPPLPEGLGELVCRAADFVQRENRTTYYGVDEGYDSFVARHLLHEVVEHGYRNDI